MSERVEQERQQKQIEERDRMERQLQVKKQAEAGLFRKVVAKMGDTQRQDGRLADSRQKAAGAQQRGQVRAQSARAQGSRASQNQGAETRHLRQRVEMARRGDKSDDERISGADLARDRILARAGRKPDVVSRGERDGGSQEGQHGGADKRRDASAAGRRGEEAVQAAGHFATPNALLGVSPNQGSGGAAGLHTDMQQMIDQIVEAVYQGVDGKGFGHMHIELKGHVLNGSTLGVQSTRDGVAIDFRTDDDEVGRLLAAGGSLQALSRGLAARKVKLKSFSVNGEEVRA